MRKGATVERLSPLFLYVASSLKLAQARARLRSSM